VIHHVAHLGRKMLLSKRAPKRDVARPVMTCFIFSASVSAALHRFLSVEAMPPFALRVRPGLPIEVDSAVTSACRLSRRSPVRVLSTIPCLRSVAALGTAILMCATSAWASSNEAALLIEADTGKVLFAENATVPWYPASITKMMTTYVTLQAVRNKRVTLDSLLTVSSRAALQAPSKMGFKPGSQVTVDNALKMLMVKSANDMAVVLAEGVSGSVEKFSAEMNQTSRRLGMTQSNWVNPNGLPARDQVSSARDLAILGRALLHDFPEYKVYWNLQAIQFGKQVVRNYNTLLGRYEGADGMKTGFICASGFNLVASATRHGKRLIAVVLGAKSSPYRGAKAAGLLERGFNRGPLAWLTTPLGEVQQLQPINVAPPDLRVEMCGPHRKRPAAESADDEPSFSGFLLSGLPGGIKPSSLVKERAGALKIVPVHLGPAKTSIDAHSAEAPAKGTEPRRGKAETNRGRYTAPVPDQQVPVTAAAVAAAAKPVTAHMPAQAPALAVLPALRSASPPPPSGVAPLLTDSRSPTLPGAVEVHSPLLNFLPSRR
jgi:D-alanyl-D-alanine carboxypeptidase